MAPPVMDLRPMDKSLVTGGELPARVQTSGGCDDSRARACLLKETSVRRSWLYSGIQPAAEHHRDKCTWKCARCDVKPYSLLHLRSGFRNLVQHSGTYTNGIRVNGGNSPTVTNTSNDVQTSGLLDGTTNLRVGGSNDAQGAEFTP
jgi:hypothetical protein